MKEVEVKDKAGNVYKVYLDEITYGQRCQILKNATSGKLVRDGIDAELDVIELERGIVLASIVRIEPEVKVSKEVFLNNLPISEAQKIVAAAIEINPLGI